MAPDTLKALEAVKAGHVRHVVPPQSPTTVLADGEGSLLTTAQGTPQDLSPEASADRLFKAEPVQAKSTDVQVCAPSTPSGRTGCGWDESVGSKDNAQPKLPASAAQGPSGDREDQGGPRDGAETRDYKAQEAAQDPKGVSGRGADGEFAAFENIDGSNGEVASDSQQAGVPQPQPKERRGTVSSPQTPPRTEQVPDAARGSGSGKDLPESCRPPPEASASGAGDALKPRDDGIVRGLVMRCESREGATETSKRAGGSGYPGDRGPSGSPCDRSASPASEQRPHLPKAPEQIIGLQEREGQEGYEGWVGTRGEGGPSGSSGTPRGVEAGAGRDAEERAGTQESLGGPIRSAEGPDGRSEAAGRWSQQEQTGTRESLGGPIRSAGGPRGRSEAAGRWSPQEQEVVDSQCTVSGRADVLVTDLLDHGVLGLDLLKAVDYAGMRLLKPGALVLPAHVQVGPNTDC